MTTQIEPRSSELDVDELILRLTRASRPSEIELLATALGAIGNRRAIRPLLMRLGDVQGPDNASAEAAVCRALMTLHVMSRCRDGSYRLQPRISVPDDVAETVQELAAMIPWPYFGTRRI